MGDKQTQRSGDESLNIQAQSIHVGLSYTDARQIAHDVFEANFYRLSNEARQIAQERAEALIDAYLKKLSEKNPAAVESTGDPDMQYALFTAQKEYARTGDEDLGAVLVDILVARAGAKNRSMRQIVLNESLSVATKLTTNQFDVLSLIFLLRYTRLDNSVNLSSFYMYLENSIEPFLTSLSMNELVYQHLEYAGCGSVDLGNKYLLDQAFLMYYKGIFQKGVTEAQINGFLGEGALTRYRNLFIPCLRAPMLYQVAGMDEAMVRQLCQVSGCPEEIANKFVSLQNQNIMNPGELRNEIITKRPKFRELFHSWERSSLGFFTLTTVGIAIAHANAKRKINEQTDLSAWIS